MKIALRIAENLKKSFRKFSIILTLHFVFQLDKNLNSKKYFQIEIKSLPAIRQKWLAIYNIDVRGMNQNFLDKQNQFQKIFQNIQLHWMFRKYIKWLNDDTSIINLLSIAKCVRALSSKNILSFLAFV